MSAASRRAMLLAGLGSAGAGLVGCGVGEPRQDDRAGVPDLPVRYDSRGYRTGPRDGGPLTHVGEYRFDSAARGKQVGLVTLVPGGVPRQRLGVCLLLHGRFNSSAGMLALGMPEFLTQALRRGVPPFAMVAVDGDATYWVRGDLGADDPQRMLRAELPGWLRELGLDADGGVPRTALGISMGGFGALVYARNRPRPLRAAALLSPGLLATFEEARYKDVYTRQDSWAAAAPLRHLDALPRKLRLGLWCGEQDRFYPVSRELAARAKPEVARLLPGAHNDSFWRAILPETLRFLGQYS